MGAMAPSDAVHFVARFTSAYNRSGATAQPEPKSDRPNAVAGELDKVTPLALPAMGLLGMVFFLARK